MLTHIGAGRREGIVLADQLYGIAVAALADQGNIAGNIHMGGAGRHTGHGMAQPADAAAMQHVLLVVLAETAHAPKHHVRSLIANGAVGGIGNHLRGVFDQINGGKIGRAVQHLLDQNSQLRKAHAAGHAFAAGLRMAQAQKV